MWTSLLPVDKHGALWLDAFAPQQVINHTFTIRNIMRHYKLNPKWSRMGKRSQEVQENKRLAAALEYGPIRPIEPFSVFEIRTKNPNSGQEHLIEIKSDPGDGNNRYHVYLDGIRWRKPWSRWGFCRWLFGKIDPVLTDWE